MTVCTDAGCTDEDVLIEGCVLMQDVLMEGCVLMEDVLMEGCRMY